MHHIPRHSNPNAWPTEVVSRCEIYEETEPIERDSELLESLKHVLESHLDIPDPKQVKRRKLDDGPREGKEETYCRSLTMYPIIYSFSSAFRLFSGSTELFAPRLELPLAPKYWLS
jgi:hypothetical protein